MSTTPLARVEPQTFTELEHFADLAAKSNMFGAKTLAQALMIAMRGRALGLDYSTAMAAMHLIEGKPTLTADGMVAVCLSHPDVCEFFRTVESTRDRCVVEAKRRHEPPRRHEFTMDDARAAGLADKAMWKKYPRNMLRARAKSELARDMFPDLLLGLYTPEEMSEGTVIEVSVERREPAEPIDAEYTEPATPPPAPPAAPDPAAALDALGLDLAAVDRWLVSCGKKPWDARDPNEQSMVVSALRNPEGDRRKAFLAWLVETTKPAEAAK